MNRLIKKEKILTLAMLVGAAVSILVSSFTAFSRECEAIPQSVFRLHILANSDSDEDQSLKYSLRDYLMSEFSEIFSDCNGLDSAVSCAKNSLSDIVTKSEKFIAELGFDYSVSASVEKTYFNTRCYNGITVPAGEYESLRIVLGEGKGKNWWCVMFPPLCLPAVSAQGNDSKIGIGSSFDLSQSKKIESGQGVEIRFALFDFLCSLFGG